MRMLQDTLSRTINKFLQRQTNMLIKTIRNFFNEEAGATTVEYAILLTLLALVVAKGALAMGVSANNAFETIGSVLPN